MLAGIFLRGFGIVTCVALNVRNVSELQYGRALVTGGLVSLIWFTNAKTASLTDSVYGKWCYAAGAAVGTVFGMWLGS